MHFFFFFPENTAFAYVPIFQPSSWLFMYAPRRTVNIQVENISQLLAGIFKRPLINLIRVFNVSILHLNTNTRASLSHSLSLSFSFSDFTSLTHAHAPLSCSFFFFFLWHIKKSARRHRLIEEWKQDRYNFYRLSRTRVAANIVQSNNPQSRCRTNKTAAEIFSFDFHVGLLQGRSSSTIERVLGN